MNDIIRKTLCIGYGKLFSTMTPLISDEKYAKDTYRLRFGKPLSLNHPQTFNEHICARKVLADEAELWRYTDKYEVRQYVEKTAGREHLNTVIGVFDSFEDIDFSKLPAQFALKATHGSGYNILVKDKSEMRVDAARRRFTRWLATNYYHVGREHNYAAIRPRIMIDEFLSSRTGYLEEAKVYCFHGTARMISYNRQIGAVRYCDYYDANWNGIPVRRSFPSLGENAPDNGEAILRLAEKLAAPFAFVRVDLYNIEGRILFSELTFHDGGGLLPFEPPEYDDLFGRYFDEDS